MSWQADSSTGSWILERLRTYAELARLDRPIGNFLLLWPVMWSLWLAAEGVPDLDILVIFVFGVLIMRAAGCVINDYADRHIDGQVKRTRTRPFATGRVSEREALLVFVLLCLLAFALVLFTNPLTILLSLVAVVLAATYPFTKRYTHLPQVHLGVAFGWAVPMVFAAQSGELPVVVWLLMLSAVLWATVYDTMYAMVDRDDDLQIGVKSTAVLFGDLDRLMIGFLQVLMIIALIQVGLHLGLGAAYYGGITGAALLFVYQQYLIRNRERQACFRAFLNNAWLGGLVFLGIFLDIHWLGFQ
ncbi:4-hydroxybenzoate polyprenyltransferase [Halorhodospira halochloris]|uniref:4-hydroxybenzoate octaprenyltransferase n=1 Tax=Halorhodospira halochloris TaxID=1052 RepID=A0A0X8X6A6_HALHR|nr:4-hydroxybenzoate octaprenyltransferase [Halorhodospira halochloris]MBK1651049.1 4-hydroxybenzoate polyprenyltransferase [Halorhodospira halochloris]BAU56437.1 4-hydroxybenzoate polyprenyltransferase [Halorhodospira halochloris]